MPLNAANKEVVRLGPGMTVKYRLRNNRAVPMTLAARNLAFSGNGTFKVQSGAPKNEVQQLVITGTSTAGNFVISFGGQSTGNIAYSATGGTLLANVQGGLAVLAAALGVPSSSFQAGVASVGANSATIQIVFLGYYATRNVPLVTCNISGLSGGSPAVAITEVTAGTDLTNAVLSDITADGQSSAVNTVVPRGSISRSYGTDSDSTNLVGPIIAFVNTGTVGDLDIEFNLADEGGDIVKFS